MLAETQDAVLPLVPYLATLRWVFIATASPASRSRTRSVECWRRPRIGLPNAAIWLAGCPTGGSEEAVASACPLVVEHDPAFLERAADELELLPEGSAIKQMLSDYAVMRAQARL